MDEAGVRRRALDGDLEAAIEALQSCRRKGWDVLKVFCAEMLEAGHGIYIGLYADQLYEDSKAEGGSYISAQAAELCLMIRQVEGWFQSFLRARYATATREEIRFFAPPLDDTPLVTGARKILNGTALPKSRHDGVYAVLREAWPFGLRASGVALLLGCSRKQADKAIREHTPTKIGDVPYPWWSVLHVHWKDVDRNARVLAEAVAYRLLLRPHSANEDWPGFAHSIEENARLPGFLDAFLVQWQRIRKQLREQRGPDVLSSEACSRILLDGLRLSAGSKTAEEVIAAPRVCPSVRIRARREGLLWTVYDEDCEKQFDFDPELAIHAFVWKDGDEWYASSSLGYRVYPIAHHLAHQDEMAQLNKKGLSREMDSEMREERLNYWAAYEGNSLCIRKIMDVTE
jgi:hypothetical protein